MNTINIIKGVVKTTSGIGAGAIVQNACKAFTPNDAHIAIKALYGIGAFGIGCVVIEATDAYWDKLFDEIKEIINQYKLDDADIEEMRKELTKLQRKIEKDLEKEQKKEAKKKSKKSSKKKNEPIEVEFEEIEEEILEA